MRLRFLSLLSVALCLFAHVPCLTAQSVQEAVSIDARQPAQPFPHFWEQMFGSGRAVLSMRESYRNDLRQVRQITGFRYVRFHAILDDEIGVYGEDRQGKPIYNFTYVDEIYDGLLANGVKPFVEVSFMPKLLAARLDYHPFWYHPIVSPPADYAKWSAMIEAFARHLVDRYGIDEVASWYFEVWNEPNIDFWTGRPAQESYFQLYDNTARALKTVSPRIRVGGPATAQAAWVDAMIAHAAQNNIPLDFVSTHAYGNDTAMDILGHAENIPPHQMVAAAVDKVRRQIAASLRPGIPLIWSEFNATYMSETEITDSVYMGPWLANTIRECAGKVDMMSYWTFSDVFEEQGVIQKPFFGGFGLIAIDSLPKPAFNVFKLLHGLGDQQIPLPDSPGSKDVLATKAKDGTVVLAAWNLVEPGVSAPAKSIQLTLAGVTPDAAIRIDRVDAAHGNVLAAYDKMGRPQYPTVEQQRQLRAAAELGPSERGRLHSGALTLEIPPQGLAVVTIAAKR
ncbi:MAG TPA: cellulase family glycosylhydrolase [Acidobacteriaceae bacterium]|nr:cellulase family glycosylhydrolase [Acidobacteriaceae bacterium]